AEAGADRMAARDHEQRIAVWSGPRGDLRADDAARAGAIVDDVLALEPLAEPAAEDARDDVGRAAHREADDHANWLRRIGLGPGERGSSTSRAGREQHDGPFDECGIIAAHFAHVSHFRTSKAFLNVEWNVET